MTDTGNFGYGQMTPDDTSSELAVITFICRQQIAKIATTKLVQVAAVHGGGVAAVGTVDVVPLVSQIDGNGNVTPHGTVYGLPWTRSQGGTSAFIADPVVGDIGLVTCCDRDTTSAVSSLKQSPPGSFRRYDLADGFYVPCCLGVVPTQYIILTSSGIRIVSTGSISLTPASGMPVTINGNLVVTGTTTGGSGGADQITLQQHIHANNNTPPTPGH